MENLEIQEKFKVCPICWESDHLSGECERDQQGNYFWGEEETC